MKAMPWLRRSGRPSASDSSQVRSRVSAISCATRSMASSRAIGSHSVAPGRRCSTVSRRWVPVTNWKVAAPLGQRRPRLIGLSGLPSMLVMRPLRTNTRWLHPTAQYGHTDVVTSSASVVRADSSRVRLLYAPSPSGSPPFPVSWASTGRASVTFPHNERSLRAPPRSVADTTRPLGRPRLCTT